MKATSLSEMEEALRETLTMLSSPWLIRASLWLSFCSTWFRVFQYACRGEQRGGEGKREEVLSMMTLMNNLLMLDRSVIGINQTHFRVARLRANI